MSLFSHIYFEVINYFSFSSVHYFACVPVFISFTYIHFPPLKNVYVRRYAQMHERQNVVM